MFYIIIAYFEQVII